MAGRGFKVESAEFPFFLRVFRSSNDNWDVLDRPDVEPPSGSEIFAYWMVSRATACWDGHDKFGNQAGGEIYEVYYRLLAFQPADKDMRTNVAWSRWLTANREQLYTDYERVNGGRIRRTCCKGWVIIVVTDTDAFYAVER
jgi:hypothetical protein